MKFMNIRHFYLKIYQWIGLLKSSHLRGFSYFPSSPSIHLILFPSFHNPILVVLSGNKYLPNPLYFPSFQYPSYSNQDIFILICYYVHHAIDTHHIHVSYHISILLHTFSHPSKYRYLDHALYYSTKIHHISSDINYN
jgi:hypothetical protein